MAQYKDIHRLLVLNTDDSPADLQPGEVSDMLNMRSCSSDQQHGSGNAETLQGEVGVLINPDSSILYYGQSIGSDFVYPGYEEVMIGNQVWMKRNWDADYPGSKVYDDDENNRDIYGGLYTWHQAMAADFCPDGWHVPTEAEVDILIATLLGESVAGGKLKDIGWWDAPNTGASNSSGFKGMPGGKFDLLFSILGAKGLLWLQDEGVYAVTDVAGVVTVDVTGDGFLKSVETPNIHGSIYYNGYIYASPRNPYGVDGIARILKVCANDYSDVTTIEIRYNSEISTQAIYYMEQLQRIGDYIYTSAFANVGGVLTNLLVQLDTKDDSYKIFKINDAYGSGSAIPLTCDDTYLYYVVNQSSGDPDYFITTTIIKYFAIDFQNPIWTKFNTSIYGSTGVPVVPVSVTEFLADDYYAIHAGCTDNTHLYLAFNYGNIPVTAGKLLKINKVTMAVDGSANIPNVSDDIDNSATHVFLSTETASGDYGSTWAVVAVRKSDMAVTELLPHSSEGANAMSYGVQLLNIGGVDYLFDLRKDKRINILDIANVDAWTDAVPSDAESKRILSFIYSDAPILHYIFNEIIIDDDEVIHVFGWATVPELVKFRLTPL